MQGRLVPPAALEKAPGCPLMFRVSPGRPIPRWEQPLGDILSSAHSTLHKAAPVFYRTEAKSCPGGSLNLRKPQTLPTLHWGGCRSIPALEHPPGRGWSPFLHPWQPQAGLSQCATLWERFLQS